MKETILKISNPMPKVKVQADEDELPPEITQTQEIGITEELHQPESESTDIVESAALKFTTTYHSGWKVSDILREIRLDTFEMGGGD